MMKHLLLAVLLLLPVATEAQTVSVILNDAGTAVIGVAPQDNGQSYNPPATIIATSDARWTNFVALQAPVVAGLLKTGVAMTFSGASSAASDSYAATADAIQALRDIYTGGIAIRGNSTISVQGNTGPHSMSSQAFKDLYSAVSDYNAAVLAAQATAIANAAAPVWPVATATSVH